MSLLLYIIMFCVVIYLIYYLRRREYMCLPAPPFYLPWIGHIPLFFNNGDPINHMADLYRKYSRNGILFIHMVGLDQILIGDFKTIEYLFNHPDVTNRGHHNLKQNNIHKKNCYDRGLDISQPSPGLVLSQGSTWVQQRRLTLKLLKDFGFGKSPTEDVVSVEVGKFLQYLQTKDLINRPVDLSHTFNLPILNVLWTFTSGNQFNYDDPRLHQILDKITSLFKVANVGTAKSLLHVTLPKWIFNYFPTFLDRNIAPQITKLVIDLMNEVIEEHAGTIDTNNPRDFIDAMLIEIARTTDTASSFYKKRGRDNLVITLLDLFLAGTETTSTTLTWGLLYMARESKVQLKIQQELDRVVGRDRLPLYTDKSFLPYTCAVIMEIQRCGNIAPMGVWHYTSKPVTVNGLVLPADTMISPIMVEVLKGDHWGSDSKCFRPERFITEDGKLLSNENLIPFGIGKRRCLGESLAKIEIFQFFAGLLQSYTVLPEDPTQPPAEDYVMGLTITPKPFKCILKPRN